jgi:hypothetical protein
MSKGSKQRPKQVSNEEYANRWDAIFDTHPEDEPIEEVTQEEPKKEIETHDNS